MALSSYRWTYWTACYSVTPHIIKLQVCSSLLWLQEAIGWFIHLNCCHGSQRWRRALLLWEHLSKRAFRVCWGENTLRYVCLALFLYISVCVHACVSYCVMSQSCHDVCQCLRNTTRVSSPLVRALLWSSPLKPHLVLADHASIAMVTSQTVAKVTTRCIRVAGIKTVYFTSQPRHSLQKVCISPIHATETKTDIQRQEGRQRPFEHYCMHD